VAPGAAGSRPKTSANKRRRTADRERVGIAALDREPRLFEPLADLGDALRGQVAGLALFRASGDRPLEIEDRAAVFAPHHQLRVQRLALAHVPHP
jgi:hypothetical protein